MSNRVVIGVDPGKTTGIYVYSSDRSPKPALETQAMQVRVEHMPFVLNGLFHLATAHYGGYCHVAVERFIINARTAKSSQQGDALEVTGMVKAVAALQHMPEVRQYMKANLKFASDAALRRAGWYDPKQPHANDAARQAYALLKDVDYPTWLDVSNGAMMKIDDKMKGQG
jgi:hypothetical protein